MESTNDWADSEEDEEYGELRIENSKERTPERTVRFVSTEKSNPEGEPEDIVTGANPTERSVILVSPEKHKSGIDLSSPEGNRVGTDEGEDPAGNKAVSKRKKLDVDLQLRRHHQPW